MESFSKPTGIEFAGWVKEAARPWVARTGLGSRFPSSQAGGASAEQKSKLRSDQQPI
jgi:hypothetical protein